MEVLDYVEATSDKACTATAEASADLVVAANTINVDGSTPIIIRFYCSGFTVSDGTSIGILWLYEDASSIGRIWDSRGVAAGVSSPGFTVETRLTPTSGDHDYEMRGTVNTGGQTFTVKAGAGGAATRMPLHMLILSE